MKKNKKGFTIIELLIAIAILLSILFIAILSLSKASTRKKEEAYQKVEEQIITAAEEYAISNEYILKEKRNDDERYVLLKDLIGGEKLNKVTNPKTGKTIGKCSKVYFDANLKATKFVESKDTDCGTEQPPAGVTELAKPEIKVVVFEGESEINDSNWHNGEKELYTKITIVNEDKYTNGETLSLKYYNGSSWEDSGVFGSDNFINDLDAFKFNGQYKNGKDVSAIYKVVASKDSNTSKSDEKKVSVNIDTEPPSCKTPTVRPNGTNYTYNLDHKLISVTLSAEDETSDIDGDKTKKFENGDLKFGDNVTYEHTFKDKAGNTKVCSTNVTYKNENDKSLAANPIFKKSSNYGDTYETGEWTNTNVYTNLESTGSATITTKQYSLNDGSYQNVPSNGLTISSNGPTEIKYKYCDSSNNCKETDTYKIMIDKIAPSCSYTVTAPNGNSGKVGEWYNKKTGRPSIKFTSSDGLSGLSSGTPSPVTYIAADGSKYYSQTFTDNVGNSNTCGIQVNYNDDTPNAIAIFKENNSYGNDYETGTWINKIVYTDIVKQGNSADIAKKQYSLNGGSYKDVPSNGLTISDDGTVKIKYKYCDSMNNCEETDEYIIRIDTKLPECSYSTDRSASSTGWYNMATGRPYVSLSANDDENGSGINYSASNFSSYGWAQPGTNNYSGIVYDNAGNGRVCSLTINYDNEAPSFSTVLKKKSSTGSTYIAEDWYNDNVYANVTNATSTYSKISEKSYSINDSTTYYSLSSSGTTRTETERIKFRVCNEAGNCTTSDNSQINIDKEAPTCSYSTDIYASSTGWYNKATGSPYVSFTSDDTGGSGIESSGTYSSTPTGSAQNGTTEYKGVATDKAGNKRYCELVVKYDGDDPTCTSTVNGANNNNTVEGWYNIATGKPSIKFNVSDNTSKPYSSTVNYSGTVTEGKNKVYSLTVRDNAGNTTTCTANVSYDATKPTAKMSRTTGSTTLKYEGSDLTSGIKYYKLTDSNSIPTSWNTSSQSSVNGTTDGGYNKTATYKYIHFKDEAGNTSYASAKIYQTCNEGKNKANTNEKAYFWGSQGGNCKSKTNGYYVRKYRFRSYDCTCSIDTVANKTCGDATAVETKVHPYDSDVGDYVAKIYYRGIQKGQDACQNATNEYVDHVCSEETGNLSESNSSIGWHGYRWYFGARTGRKWQNFKSAGWYHSGGCYDYGLAFKTWANSDPEVDAVKQCNIACKKATGEIGYNEDDNPTCSLKN